MFPFFFSLLQEHLCPAVGWSPLSAGVPNFSYITLTTQHCRCYYLGPQASVCGAFYRVLIVYAHFFAILVYTKQIISLSYVLPLFSRDTGELHHHSMLSR
jgi:hypothetical protein